MSILALKIQEAIQQKKAAQLTLDDVIRENRERSSEIAGKILEINRDGRLRQWERECLEKSIKHTDNYRCGVGLTGNGNFVVCFEHYNREYGWLPWEDSPSIIVIHPITIEDSAKLEAFYEKKKAEWAARDKAEENEALTVREEKLLLELEQVKAAKAA